MITHGICASAKADFLAGVHTLTDRFMVALYTSRASIGPDTVAYDGQGEVVGKGYRAGGMPLRNARAWVYNGAGCLTWESVKWGNSTITANGALIYNASKGNKALCAIAFAETCASTSGDFSLPLPADLICFD